MVRQYVNRTINQLWRFKKFKFKCQLDCIWSLIIIPQLDSTEHMAPWRIDPWSQKSVWVSQCCGGAGFLSWQCPLAVSPSRVDEIKLLLLLPLPPRLPPGLASQKAFKTQRPGGPRRPLETSVRPMWGLGLFGWISDPTPRVPGSLAWPCGGLFISCSVKVPFIDLNKQLGSTSRLSPGSLQSKEASVRLYYFTLQIWIKRRGQPRPNYFMAQLQPRSKFS